MMKNSHSRIYLSSPHMGGSEIHYVHDAFRTNWIAPLGANVDNFEKDIENYMGGTHATVVTSGTAAIHLGLILCGVQAGDEVICQSLTFSASANPIRYCGATPVFVDSETETWNIDPALLEDAILDRIERGKKPKAIVVVHLYGMPARMGKIMAIANKYDIPVVEDAAEALGSSIDGKKCGLFGKVAILSFNGNKIITTSGGGALLSSDKSLTAKARFLSTQARDEAPHYQHSQLGYNYRMSNVLAGIGRGQMDVLDDRVRARRSNHNYYLEALKGSYIDKPTWEALTTGVEAANDANGIYFLKEPQGYFSNRWLTVLLVMPQQTGGVTRKDIYSGMAQQNIECRPVWKPMHLQPLYGNAPFYGNGVSEKLFKYGLCLPSGSNLTEEDRTRVASVFNQCLLREATPISAPRM